MNKRFAHPTVGLSTIVSTHNGSVGLTFPFEEVEGAQKATGRGNSRLTLSRELGKLIPWKIDQSGDIAEYQIRKSLWMLMS